MLYLCWCFQVFYIGFETIWNDNSLTSSPNTWLLWSSNHTFANSEHSGKTNWNLKRSWEMKGYISIVRVRVLASWNLKRRGKHELSCLLITQNAIWSLEIGLYAHKQLHSWVWGWLCHGGSHINSLVRDRGLDLQWSDINS